jgi:hypothetical protein
MAATAKGLRGICVVHFGLGWAALTAAFHLPKLLVENAFFVTADFFFETTLPRLFLKR